MLKVQNQVQRLVIAYFLLDFDEKCEILICGYFSCNYWSTGVDFE